MTFRVIVHRRAQRDVRGIESWIRSRSIEGAAKWREAFQHAAASLVNTPESHSLADENDHFPENTIRQFFFKTPRGRKYRGLFIVDNMKIRVLRVRTPDQDLITREDIDLTDH